MSDDVLGKPAYNGIHRTRPLPACAVSSADLVRLYNTLQAKNDELFNDIAKTFTETPEQPLEVSKNNLRENLRVAVTATGRRGEEVVTFDASGLKEDALPEALKNIRLETGLRARAMSGSDLPNRCEVEFDFETPPLFDLTNPSGERTTNTSRFTVAGENGTWAVALFDAVAAWVEGKRLGRGWVHHPNTYDTLLLLLGFPMVLWTTWRIHGAWIKGGELEPSGIGIVVVLWIFIGLLYAFRILFGVARRVWPYVEFTTAKKGALARFRLGLGAVVLGVVAAFVYDVIRVLVR